MLLQEQKTSITRRIPPHVFFFVSAVFHYLGPSFAVLLFSSASVLGVAWFRIASAAVVFAVRRRLWRLFIQMSWAKQIKQGHDGTTRPRSPDGLSWFWRWHIFASCASIFEVVYSQCYEFRSTESIPPL
jgi:hypothetical protein